MMRLETVDLSQQTLSIDSEKGKKETNVRRNAQLADELVFLLYEGCDTLQASFNKALKDNGDRVCLGIREWKGNNYGKYLWINYRKFGIKVDHFGTGLKNKLGMKVGDRLAVVADNSAEYIVAMQACFNQGFVFVPIYPSFSGDEIASILIACKAEVVMVGPECARAVSNVAGGLKKLKHVVVVPKHGGTGKLARGKEKSVMEKYKEGGEEEEDEMGEITENFGDASTHSYNDIEEDGRENTDSGPTTAPGDTACILYTAGTTGAPKGVVHTNASLIAAIAGFVPIVGPFLPSDVYYTYLPIANPLELVCLNSIIACGGAIGAYSGHMAYLISDMEALRPTVISGIPWVYERMYRKLMQVVTKSNGMKQWLFNKGLNRKKEKAQTGGDSGWWNFMLFNKISTRMGGGRIRTAISANAALNPNVLNFLEVVLGCRVVQAYSVTEVGIAAVTNATDPDKESTVGVPVLSLEFKLVDTNRFSTKNSQPQGEICLRGPAVAKGYYKEDSSAAFDADGWFHTGDIGEIRNNGTLAIIDRDDSIATLSTNANVPLEKLESIYSRSQFVSQIYVHGDNSEPCVVAVVAVLPSVIKSFANARNVRDQFHDPDDVSALCEDEKMKNIIVSDLRKLARKNFAEKELSSHLVRGVFLDRIDWTPENGLATPMLKLKRKAVYKKYKKAVTDIYDELKAEAKAALQSDGGGGGGGGGGRGRQASSSEESSQDSDD